MLKPSTYRCLLVAKMNRTIGDDKRFDLATTIKEFRNAGIKVFPSKATFPQWTYKA